MGNLLFAIILTATLGVASAEGRQIEKTSPGDRRDTQQPATTPEKKGSAGSIRGRVVGEAGRAVANASISAFPLNRSSNPQAMMTLLLRPVTSDVEGSFQLTDLQAGAYTISASAPGYVLSDSGKLTFYRPGDTVTLTLVKGGVITGKVTNTSGDPVVGAIVRAIRIRGIDNKPARSRSDSMSQFSDSMSLLLASLGPFKTDDRGIYRIYGLEAGYYQVAAGGTGPQGSDLGDDPASAYDGDAATYFPSSTMDTAAEVTVRAGDEAINIDIRYRENRGHSLSGTVSGSKVSSQGGFQIFLSRASNGIAESFTFVPPGAKEKGFAFDAVLDGEYYLTALAGSGAMIDGGEGPALSVSPSRRVTVSGSDVTGVELVIEPLASIAGRGLIETVSTAQKAECKASRGLRIEEVVFTAQGESSKQSEDQSLAMLFAYNVTTPNEKGEFTSNYLRPGVHHLEVQLPGENHYLKTITLPSSTPGEKPIDAAKTGLKVKSGDKVKGVAVTISEGAAGLTGKVVTGKDKQPPSTKMRAHLVPAESDASDNVLRYYESEVAADGGFVFTSLAPGMYWIVAREVSDQEDPDRKPLAWDAGSRTALRFEGEGTKKSIEMASCQRISDFVVTYIPLAKPSKPVRQPK